MANGGATFIDSTLYLNVSELVLQTPGALELVNALMSSAVAAEANRQVAAAIQAAATDGIVCVGLNDCSVLVFNALATETDLILDRGRRLKIGRISGVNDGTHRIIPLS